MWASKASIALMIGMMIAAGGALAQENGERLYRMHCAACHQMNGQGVPNMQPPLAGSAMVTGEAAGLIRWLLLGSEARAEGAAPSDYENVMPGFAHMTEGQLAALLTYIRASFSNDAGAVTSEEVASIRAEATEE